MTGAKKAHDELELMLSAVANGARRKSMAETKADLKAVRKNLESYFDQLIAEVGKSSRSTFILDSKERVLKRIDGKDERSRIETEDPEELVTDIVSEARNALGWVVAKPVDPAVIAAVIERDRAAAIKAGHPVGPIKKKVV
ncbi:MAG: hypothetical protein A4E30_00103 [Methanomassiliicoccales archaeon PtaB.Bin215]|nr:MAG: hypothetical protein A4E30_00103 [Methanomassiliicoccales archaeon PtaB.Bin215]